MPILIDSLGNLLLLVVGSFWLLLLLISFCRAASYSILYTQHTHTRTSFEFHFTRDCWLSFCPSLTLTRSFFFSLSENTTDVVVVGPFFDLRCCCFCFYCNLWRAVVIVCCWLVVWKTLFRQHTYGEHAHTHSPAASTHTQTHTHAHIHSRASRQWTQQHVVVVFVTDSRLVRTFCWLIEALDRQLLIRALFIYIAARG